MTRESTPSSTPTAPLLLFLILCLLFQLPTFPPRASALTLDNIATPSSQSSHPDLLPRGDWSTTYPAGIIETLTTTVACSQCAATSTPASTQYVVVTATSSCTTSTSTTTATVYESTTSSSTTKQQPQQVITTTTTTQRGFVQGAAAQYCSTLYETGAGLPTTRAGSCGTILVEEPSASVVKARPSSMLGLVLVLAVLIIGAVG